MPCIEAGAGVCTVAAERRETESSPAGFTALLRKALIEHNRRHVNLVVCEEVYRALRRGIENLGPGVQ